MPQLRKDISEALFTNTPLMSSWQLSSIPKAGLVDRRLHPVKEWAMITVGRNPGVFHGSQSLMGNVEGIPGSSVVKFLTQEEANEAFSTALSQGSVERVVVVHNRTPLTTADVIPGMDLPNSDSRVNVVYIGRNPGIFAEKTTVNANIQHIPGGRSQKYTSVARARRDFINALVARLVFRVEWKVVRTPMTHSDFGNKFLRVE